MRSGIIIARYSIFVNNNGDIMLSPAKNNQSFAKVGLYGSAGSGKTRTATEIAIGLHKKIGSNKPIVAFDTEPAFSWVLPIFEKQGIELLVEDTSRALVDLMKFMDEAEKVSDIAIVDSVTHVWRDAQESYLKRLNEKRKQMRKPPLNALEFQHWRPIKAAWSDFTDRFLSSKMHVIVCGRAGNIYEYQDKDDGTGKKELISTGTKMATEKELAYEPSLLIEMIADRRNGKTVNVGLVQKDRSGLINGQEIEFPNYEKLRLHFDRLNLGGAHFDSMEQRDSKELYPDAEESGWDNEKREREIWCEEVQGLLTKHYPSQSAADKSEKVSLIEKVFSTRSWTKVESMKSSEIRKGFEAIKSILEPTNKTNTDWRQMIMDATSKSELEAIKNSIPKDEFSGYSELYDEYMDYLRNLAN